MRYPRTFATPDGESHFEDVEVQHETVAVVPGRPAFNVGAAIVDVSPLSILGALCVVAVPDGPPARTLFRQLLI
jgi:hypothetical protein